MVIGAMLGAALAGACQRGGEPASSPADQQPVRPSILLVTLDTTRADAMGPEASGVETPAFNALAARGRRFSQAYATVPETLPSHSSIMTGLYPAGHGVHENARTLSAAHPRLAERLQQSGYRAAAFVSSFVLARRFGLARGFDVYDDELPDGQPDRTSRETTDRALAYLDRPSQGPLLLWVHYFDPHTPYAPPEPFRRQFPDKPYLGEVAAMDQQLGRLVEAFERRVAGPVAIAVVSDHGEGLGDHGESQHGNLLYQSTMRVPMVLVGPGVAAGVSDAPVSIRRVFHTILDWAGLSADQSLRGPSPSAEVVLGEAMKPYLQYGWQPQIMSVEGRQKVIFAGTNEVYDLAADPKENADLGSGASVTAAVRKALDDYPVPSPDAASAPENLSEDARRSLASLGYVSASVAPVVREDAPKPADMVRLFEVMERASALFVREEYGQAVPLLQQILKEDPFNLDAALRLATAWSALGQDARAMAMFRKAAGIAPRSPDVRMYLALHYARAEDWARAGPLLEPIVAETPDRLPALEALALVRERQDRFDEALALRQRVYELRTPTPAELAGLGQLAMNAQQTAAAIAAFEKARAAQGQSFAHDLELGVLYLASRRFEDARAALDRVLPSHPEYPMALFKRAQVSVLLKEPDSATRVELARRHADSTTRELIAKEKLFR
jgi:tetratricopeptide (TPR) repeat protein